MDGITTSVTNAISSIQNMIAGACGLRANASPIALVSGSQQFVGGAEKFIVNAVRGNARQRQGRNGMAQERPRTANIVMGISDRRVGDQPLVGDDPGDIIIATS